jgi:class 3 adenylate cyclase
MLFHDVKQGGSLMCLTHARMACSPCSLDYSARLVVKNGFAPSVRFCYKLDVAFSLTNEHRARMEEFRRRQRSGILVLLFTDMVGSTKLKQDLGDQQAVPIIRQHHAIIRQLLTGFPDGQGD